ncbi:PadR family transcriptional regulator [Saccharibacillus sp. CPCC 101409]|uniref:PadR family transcriptional regulator n=1 Tax=Saccharibacillus sp. CPCC 101409 TaxID=3058041 RepID=UPI00267282C8|nr:PadR family transcriptional regulator [Saccharibacillus sp. CPCC 101409]MDO3412623.1 PadR family transcriptional regulator [Saccharibacillus sp. CPCC 101409]
MSLQIVILGMLWDRDGHPYELKKRIQHFELDDIISITDGSLYYNIEALVKKGFIIPVEVVHTENRPDKTTYAITEEGKRGLEENIYKLFRKSLDVKSLYSAIPFIRRANGGRLAILIEDTIVTLKHRAELVNKNKELHPELREREEIWFLGDLAEQSLQTEIRWFERLLEIVKRMGEPQTDQAGDAAEA